jgi:hypothetical protein
MRSRARLIKIPSSQNSLIKTFLITGDNGCREVDYSLAITLRGTNKHCCTKHSVIPTGKSFYSFLCPRSFPFKRIHSKSCGFNRHCLRACRKQRAILHESSAYRNTRAGTTEELSSEFKVLNIITRTHSLNL